MKEKNQKVRLDWQRLEQEDFDRLVEALLHRVHYDANKVWSPEDSGGDGGRDVLVEYDDKTLIYQLKCYKDGLTSKPESRKQQIIRSFKAALKHEPDEWVLVFPSKINDSMSKFLTLLPTRKEVKDVAHASKVKITFLDRPKLDDLLSHHPDLLNLVEREEDYVMRAAQLYGQERAVLAGGVPDLAARVEGLGDLAAGVDPHWGVSFWHDGERTVVSPVAKHPNAGLVSPIKQDLTLRFPKTAEELAAQAQNVFGYGARDILAIPGEYVEMGKYVGPDFFKWDGEIETLFIMAGEGNQHVLGKPVRLVVLDEDGEVLVDDEGTVSYGALGSVGQTLEMSLSGRVTIEMRAPLTEGDAAELTMRQQAHDASPAEVRDGAAIIGALHRAATMEVHLDGHRAHVFGSPQKPGDQDYLARVDGLRLVADDLAVIQQHLKQTFPMPAVIDPIERLWLRALRIALDGGVAPIPRNSVKIELLDTVNTEDVSAEAEHAVLWFSEKGATAYLAGRDLRLPALAYTHPRATHTVDVEARTAVFTPADEEVFVVYAPGLLRDKTGKVSPWSLPKVEEPQVPTLHFNNG